MSTFPKVDPADNLMMKIVRALHVHGVNADGVELPKKEVFAKVEKVLPKNDWKAKFLMEEFWGVGQYTRHMMLLTNELQKKDYGNITEKEKEAIFEKAYQEEIKKLSEKHGKDNEKECEKKKQELMKMHRKLTEETRDLQKEYSMLKKKKDELQEKVDAAQRHTEAVRRALSTGPGPSTE